jgi:hypothetical protein
LLIVDSQRQISGVEELTMKITAIPLPQLRLTSRADLAARLPHFITLMKPRVMVLAVFTALVGKNYAVLERGWLRTGGFLTWLVWAFVHVLSLPQLQNRLRVQHQWVWSYFTGQRSSRLIPEPPRTI